MYSYKLPYSRLNGDNINFTNITEPVDFSPIGDLDDFIFGDDESYCSER